MNDWGYRYCMKKLAGLTVVVVMLIPTLVCAQGLTIAQIGAILGLLQAFGASPTLVSTVQQQLSTDLTASATPVTFIGFASTINVDKTIISCSGIHIEWNTPIPTNSKLFVNGQVYSSNSGLSRNHVIEISTQGFNKYSVYTYKIEAITPDNISSEITGSFRTYLCKL